MSLLHVPWGWSVLKLVRPGAPAQSPCGRQRIRALAWPGETSLSLVARRFCFVVLAASRCRKPGVRRMSLPRAVNLKRLATDFLVFCMTGAVEHTEWRPGWQGENPRRRRPLPDPGRAFADPQRKRHVILLVLRRRRHEKHRRSPDANPVPPPTPKSRLRAMLALATSAGPFAHHSGAQSPPAEAAVAWSLHEQATWIAQGHPSFNSPYEGPNSFTSGSEADRTFSLSVFLGFRVWSDTELYFNPEVFQGHGLSGTLGVAGFPNGESGKAAFPNLHYNTSRLFIRHTFGLGGETEKIEDDQNQVAGVQDVNRLTLTAGKFAASDFFDANGYSHDTRTQFLNWSLWESAAWDYPADVVGYTAGLVAEWNTKNWTLHYGVFMEPTVPNGARLDYHLANAHGQILQLDRRYALGDLSGTVRPFVFWNQARMGNYSDALASPDIGDALSQSRAYRSKLGFGVSWDQQLAGDLG